MISILFYFCWRLFLLFHVCYLLMFFLALFMTLVPLVLVPFDVSHDLGSLPFSIGMHGTGVFHYVI